MSADHYYSIASFIEDFVTFLIFQGMFNRHRDQTIVYRGSGEGGGGANILGVTVYIHKSHINRQIMFVTPNTLCTIFLNLLSLFDLF